MKAGLRTMVALGLSALAIGGVGTATAGTDAGGDAKAKRGECKLTLALARSTYATYIEELKVRGTRCKKGWKVTRAFHECRKENGGRDGRCKSRVKRFKCKEGKREGVKGVRYRAKVTCKKGGDKIKHQYSMSL